ncbi:hypothetical protein TWF703_006006 [Orbilia oligospora]|uniref:PA14 domain-containing protein n=1 Tax=Orbilia oligospora TaxID=2813651 RepID=A0A7C8NYB5_ORBOL|nr:hypothetical protein TWF703_006006 [Orbilia oligospora]
MPKTLLSTIQNIESARYLTDTTLSPARALLLLSFVTSTLSQPGWQPGRPANQGAASGWQPGQQQQPVGGGGGWQPGQQQGATGGAVGWQPGQQQGATGGAVGWQPGQQQQPPPQQQQPPVQQQQPPVQQQQPPPQQQQPPPQQQQPPVQQQQPPVQQQQPPPQQQQPPVQQQQPPTQGGAVTLPGTYNPSGNVQNTAICGQNNLQTYSAPDGSHFMLKCNTHHWSKTLESTRADTLQGCIDKCAAKDGCKAVNFDAPNGKGCYLMGEGGLTNKAVDCPNHHYAFLVDPPTQPAANDMTVMCSTECPYANHNTYNTIFGSAFRIVCNRRHATPHILSEGQASFKDCMNACAGINGCDSVDYHERSKTCYYSNHKGYPPVEATGYSSAWNVGCANACGGGCGCGSGTPGTPPQIPVQKGPLKPDTSCGNLGMQHYASPNTDLNGNKVTDIANFDPTVLKRRDPNTAGQTSDNPSYYRHGTNVRIGFNAGSVNPVDIYGTPHDFGQYADLVAINHRAYIFAPEDGTYTFSLPSSDDITLLWVGQKAYSGWNRQNADIIQKYVSSGGTPVTFRTDLRKGTYTPIRIAWANRGGAANFKLRIMSPDGSVLLAEDSESNDYIVQHSCDGYTAPKFPEWGFET